MMSTAKIKGNELESAVERIERLIVSASGKQMPDAVNFERNVVAVIAGVRHEVDLRVRFVMPGGYHSTFLFECKNWNKKVGKTEVLDFAEKLRAFEAQRGFFVAKTFTRSAHAQAKVSERITLVAASVSPVSPDPFPDIHWVIEDADLRHTQVTYEIKGGVHPDMRVDPKETEILIDGSARLAGVFLWELGGIVKENRLRTEPTASHAPGTYRLTGHKRFEYPNAILLVGGRECTAVDVELAFTIHVVRPAVISRWHVEGRGRTLTLEGTTPKGGFIRNEIVVLANEAARVIAAEPSMSKTLRKKAGHIKRSPSRNSLTKGKR